MNGNLWVHLGAGTCLLPSPWLNHDLDVDLRNRLPWDDGQVQYLFLEHVIEHLTPAEAWAFFRESYRVLRGGGVLRMAFPSVELVWAAQVPHCYVTLMRDRGWGDPSLPPQARCIGAIVCAHGHHSLWSVSLLKVLLEAFKFKVVQEVLWRSAHSPLVGLEQHHTEVGREAVVCETQVVEAQKPA